MVKSWHLTHFILLLYLLTLIRPAASLPFSFERGIIEQSSLSTYVFQRGITASLYFPSVCMLIMVLQTLPLSCGGEEISATLNAIIPGDITLGGLFPVHDKSTDPTMPCGRSINAERGIQVMLAFQLWALSKRTKYLFIFECILDSPVFLNVNTTLILFGRSPKPIVIILPRSRQFSKSSDSTHLANIYNCKLLRMILPLTSTNPFCRGGIFAASLCCVFKLCSLFSVLSSVSLF